MHVKGVGFGVYVTITTSGAGPENVTIGKTSPRSCDRTDSEKKCTHHLLIKLSSSNIT